MVAGIVIAMALAAVAVLGFRQSWVRRKTARIRGRRAPGVVAFAQSLKRSPSEAVVGAVFDALAEVGGAELARARADDTIDKEYGIVDEDVDRVVVMAAERLGGGKRERLMGTYGDLRTPREIVEFLERL